MDGLTSDSKYGRDSTISVTFYDIFSGNRFAGASDFLHYSCFEIVCCLDAVGNE